MLDPEQTLINGRETPWPEYVWNLWRALVAVDLQLWTPLPVIRSANYFTPRPAQEYDRGNVTEGFTWQLGAGGVGRVYQTITGRYTPGTPAWETLMALRARYQDLPYA